MAKKVHADYKKAFEKLVEAIRYDAVLWRAQVDSVSVDDRYARHMGMLAECEYLLEQADLYKAECMGQVNENGRVSLHLLDRTNETYAYDLDCNVGELPERLWCEDMHTISGNGYDIDTQENHMHNVRMNGEYGVPLVGVYHTDRFVWTNDFGYIVDGPEVWTAKYRDTALAAS